MIRLFIPAFLLVFQSVIAQNLVPDPNFGVNGLAESNLATGTSRMDDILIQPNAAIVAAGNALNFTTDFQVYRMLSTGLPDNTFGNQGFSYVDFAKGDENLKSMALQSDGKIVLAGSTQSSNFTLGALARLNSNGTLDENFGQSGTTKFQVSTGAFSTIQKVVVLSDGAILVGGYYIQNSVYHGFVRKYLSNGTVDSLFGTNGTTLINFGAAGTSSYITSLTLLPDGKIMLFGQNYTNRFILGLARLNSNGSLDNTFSGDGIMTHSFGNGQNYSTEVFSVSDSKILIVGYANSTTADYKVFTARFSSGGLLDNTYGTSGVGTFSPNSSYTDALGASILSDESILISGEGYFTNVYQAMVYKVGTNGSLQTSFGTNGYMRINTGSNSGFCMKAIPRGTDILAVGAIYSSNENANFSLLAGITSTGTVLNSFGTNGQIILHKKNANTQGIHLNKTSDGKYLVNGQVENYDLDQLSARFNPNGNADASFGTDGASVVDFGTADYYRDRLVLDNDDVVQLAGTGQTTLNFSTLGVFTGISDYGLSKVTNSGIQKTSLKKFRFSDTEFTDARAIRKDVQGRIYVLGYQVQPTRAAGYISRHDATTFALDNTFATAGKYQLYSFDFTNSFKAEDFQIDSLGNFFVLFNTGNQSVAGFRVKKFNNQMQSDVQFGNQMGTLVVEDPVLTGFLSYKIYLNKNGLLVTGIKQNVQGIYRVNFSGQVLGTMYLPDFKFISTVQSLADGSFYVLGTGQNDKFRLVHFLADGTPNSTFNGTGVLTDTYFSNVVFAYDFVVEEGGAIVILARTQIGTQGQKLGLIRLMQVTKNKEKLNHSASEKIIFPNPVVDKIYWKSSSSREVGRVHVVDILGRIIVAEQSGIGSQGIDVSELPTGSYKLIIEDSKSKTSHSFLKQ